MKVPRIYIDTSIVGGCLDEEFEEESRALFEMARSGALVFLISDLLVEELLEAPVEVRSILESLPDAYQEFVMCDDLSEQLRDRYLDAAILGKGSEADAHHVALATVARADMIVSWNFKHIVHYEKMRGFNSVNLVEGYGTIEIHSPKEVV